MRAETLPIHALSASCMDPRFPVFHHDWIVGCNHHGLIEKLYHPQTRQTLKLPRGYEVVGLGEAIQLGKDGAFFIEEKTLNRSERILEQVNAPPTGRAEVWAYTTEDAVYYKEGRQAKSITANPIGWYPPALWGGQVVWVEDSDGKEVLWVWDLENIRILTPSSSAQRHPISSGPWLGWIEDAQIQLWNVLDQSKRIINAQVVDRLALYQETACWSQWGDIDIDIHCSNGFVLKRKKHQLWPSLSVEGLLFQEDGRLMLHRFED